MVQAQLMQSLHLQQKSSTKPSIGSYSKECFDMNQFLLKEDLTYVSNWNRGFSLSEISDSAAMRMYTLFFETPIKSSQIWHCFKHFFRWT